MTIHVLIACSKSKSSPPSNDLIWQEQTTTQEWSKLWERETKLTPAKELYIGRAFQQQLSLCLQYAETKPHILSAGAGLISDIELPIPSYEATFQGGLGPKKEEWKNLPSGGLDKLQLKPEDVVISFAPPSYHQALLNDDIGIIAPQLIVPETSPLANIASSTLPIHPRAKEALGVADVDLNTAFLETYLSEGFDGFLKIKSNCDSLPPPVIRRKVSDDELLEIVRNASNCKTIGDLVRHLRDDLRVAASHERISKARRNHRR